MQQVIRFLVSICTIPLAVLTGSTSSSSEPFPFEQFSVPQAYRGKTVLPQFDGRDRAYKDYRTRIRDGLKVGPSFAGEFSVIQIGCGTGCSFVYVANNRTGQVFDFLRGGEENLYLQLDFNISSRLLVTQWANYDTDACTLEQFEWTGKEAKLLNSKIVGKLDSCYQEIAAHVDAAVSVSDAPSKFTIVEEGEAGPEASLSLDEPGAFKLGMFGCKKSGNSVTLELVLFIDESASVSPALAELRNVSAETQDKLDVCINDRCKLYQWTINDYFGALSTSVTIDRQENGKVSSYRIVVPNDATKYEFRGDGDSILEKICIAE